MARTLVTILLAAFTGSSWGQPGEDPPPYFWLQPYDAAQSVAKRIAPPAGYERQIVVTGSFEEWLRGLPLKPGTPEVRLFNGRPKSNQHAHFAVVDIDVGNRDLQQCADTIIRLRAEYLFGAGRFREILFRFTSGDQASFDRWTKGERAQVRRRRVVWRKTAQPDKSYRSLRAYLNMVFTYAGTLSLERHLQTVAATEPVCIGDVFVQGGSPGHAVMVVDVAVKRATGERVFLLAQGFMPAQDVHILKNPKDPAGSPWYSWNGRDPLITPEWTFAPGARRRFPFPQPPTDPNRAPSIGRSNASPA